MEGIAAGLLAGMLMSITGEIGYRTGKIKSHLVIVDGLFALRLLKKEESTPAIYVMGTLIHLATSVFFGVVYVVLVRLLEFDPLLLRAIALYAAMLWAGMLLVALPIAGQGMMGNKMGQFVWAEQIVLHLVYGLGFWWALRL
jgi:hypothetical protein